MARPRAKRPLRPLVATMLRLGALLALLLRPFGVDRARFLAVLEVRLLEDFGRGKRAAAEGRPARLTGSMVVTLLLHLMLGAFLAFVLHEVKDPRTGLFWVFVAVMAFVTTTLMADHASTMSETKDLEVLGPLPVDGRTLLAARVAHTALYFVLLVGSIGLPVIAGGAHRFGFWPFAPAMLLALAVGTATCFALAMLLLVAALRFVAPARVRTVSIVLQTFGGIGAFAAFQLLPHVLEMPMEWLFAEQSPWPWLLPPAHCAALVLTAMDSPLADPRLALLALAVPALLLGLIAMGSRRFQDRLLGMASAERTHKAPPRRRWLRDRLLQDRVSIAGYDFVAALSARERQFRMRAWPAVAMAWFLAGWNVWRVAADGVGSKPELACLALYVVGLGMPQVIVAARFADDWQARWLFQALPLQHAGHFAAGGALALLLRFTLPATALTALFVLLIGGIHIAPDVGYTLLVVAWLSLLSLRYAERRMPFTEKFLASAFQGSFVRTLGWMLLAGVLALLHMAVRADTWFFSGALVLLATVVLLQSRSLARRLQRPDRLRLHWSEGREAARA